MRAVVMRSFGGPEVLNVEDVQLPEPGEGEVRVRIGAVLVSFTRDAATRSGNHPYSRAVSLPHILGGDSAGIVDAVGLGVDGSLVGRRVAGSILISCGSCASCAAGHDEACEKLVMVGIHRPGSYAEHVILPAENVHEIPDDLSFVAAAALAGNGPVAGAQLETGGVGEGTWVLVPGASGGLGSTLTILGVRHGARVISLARHGFEMVESLGPEVVLNADREDLADALLEITDGMGVDIVVDNVCVAGLFERYMPALALRGRVVVSGAIGAGVVPLNVRPLYVGVKSILGLRSANRAQKSAFWEEVRAGLRLPAGLVEAFPLERAAEAHARLAEKRKTGHYVLTTGLE